MANDKLLKDIQCKQAKPKKRVFLNDGLGLRLQIKPNGNKIWQFRYTYNGQRKLPLSKVIQNITWKCKN